jgi:hypothetical protein
MTFLELTSIALIGTERHELPRPNPGTPITELQAQLDCEAREKALLSASALASVHERAGRVPSRDSGPAPTPCESETFGRCSTQSGEFLMRMLAGEFDALLPEWLRRAGALRQLAPPEALPALLTRATESMELRDVFVNAIGKRGLWLCAQNPQWSWVVVEVGKDEGAWHTGDTRARILYLKLLRSSDPDRARDLLISSWSNESPEDRAALLDTLSETLNSSDEAFLETVLDDKRKEVRRKASSLLAILPNSRLATRMIERARPLLRFVPGESGNIEVTLPTNCDKLMQRDGIELKPQHGMGEKASWLIQILEVVPLNHWTEDWHTIPSKIVAASLIGEWRTELIEAWIRASIRQGNAEWAEALLDASPEQLNPARIQELLGILPPSRREAHVMGLLEDEKRRELRVTAVMQSVHADWSPEFSRCILQWLRNLTAQESMDWQVRSTMKSIAMRLDPSILPEVAHDWPVDSVGWGFWAKGVEDLLSVSQFRHDFLTALQLTR